MSASIAASEGMATAAASAAADDDNNDDADDDPALTTVAPLIATTLVFTGFCLQIELTSVYLFPKFLVLDFLSVRALP